MRMKAVCRKPRLHTAKGAGGRDEKSGMRLFMHAIDKKAENSLVGPAV